MFTTLTSASFLILILTSVGYNKPENYKRGILKTLFAWLLMTIAISFLVTNIVVSIDLLKSGSMDFFRILNLPALPFWWSLYIFKCGPMHSAIWKRIVKTILYIVYSILFSFISYLPFDVLLDEPMVLIALSIIFFIVWGIILKLNNTPKKQENQA